jgi:adenosine deaminase
MMVARSAPCPANGQAWVLATDKPGTIRFRWVTLGRNRAIDQARLHRFISAMPKAELHLHIEGTLEPELMMALARRNGVQLPYDSVEAIRQAYRFSSLQDFLDLYYVGMSVLRGRQDFFDLAFAYLEKVAAQNVTHVEIFFDPQGHTGRGVAFDTVLAGLTDALDKGRRDFGITSKLIMCFLRHLPEEQAFDTLKQACRCKEHIFAVGLDSTEEGHPPSKFARVYAEARKEGFVPVAHAGEEGPAAYVREAIDILQIRRIDHGNRALEDPALVARIAREQIPLTVCPLSNQALQSCPDLTLHPLKRMLAAGLLVTVNSDDPSYFGGYVNENFVAIQQALALTEGEIARLARNSFVASFMPDAGKAAALAAFDAFEAKW